MMQLQLFRNPPDGLGDLKISTIIQQLKHQYHPTNNNPNDYKLMVNKTTTMLNDNTIEEMFPNVAQVNIYIVKIEKRDF